MSGFYPVLEYLTNGINRARDTKQAIISAVDSYENIKRRTKEIEEEKIKNGKYQKQEEVYFDPAEIEPIVLRDNLER